MANKRRGRRPQKRNNVSRRRRKGGSKAPLIIGIIGGAIVLIAAVAIVLVLLLSGGGNSPKGAIKEYYQKIANGDAYGIEELLPPAGLAILEDEGGLGESGKYISRMMQDDDTSGIVAQDQMFYGCGKIRVEVSEVSSAAMSELSPVDETMLGEVEEIAACQVKISSDDLTDTRTVYAFKVDGKWYCMNAVTLVWWIM